MDGWLGGWAARALPPPPPHAPCNFKEAIDNHGTYKHKWNVYYGPIISLTQDWNAQEPNLGGNLSLAQDI